MSLEKCLEELPSPDKPISSSRLLHLSNLAPEEMLAFVEAWAAMGTERRRKTICHARRAGRGQCGAGLQRHLPAHTLTDDDAEVRANSISGLWECEERSLIDPLIRLMNDDPEEHVRGVAAQALGRFALLAETGKLLERDHGRISDALLAVIDGDGETLEVRRRAIEAVAPMSIPRVLELITEAYHQGEPKLRASAIYAMGFNCDPKWLPILLAELENEDTEMRYEAVGALGQIGEEDAVPRLAPLIRDSDAEVQAAAVAAVGSIGGPVAKTVLNEALENADPVVQELAKAALQSMGFSEDPPGVPHPPLALLLVGAGSPMIE